MPRRTLLIMIAAAVVTVIVVAFTSTGSGVVLPGPHSVSYADAQAAAAAHSTTGRGKTTTSTTAPATARPSPVGPGQQVVTTVPPVVLTMCTVVVSDPHPAQGHTQQTVTVTAVANAEVRIVASYPRATSIHSELADSTGTAVFNLSIASSPVGVTVGVTATASYGKQKPTCQTSFTPVA